MGCASGDFHLLPQKRNETKSLFEKLNTRGITKENLRFMATKEKTKGNKVVYLLSGLLKTPPKSEFMIKHML